MLHGRAAATSSPRSKHQLRRSPLQHAALRRPRISLLSGCSLRARGSGTSGQGAGGCCSSRSGSFSSSVDRRPWGRRKRCCCHPRVPLGHYGRANSLTHQTVDGPAHPWPKPIVSHLPETFLVGAPCGVPGGHLWCSARGHKMTNAVRYASGTMSGPQGSSTCTLHWFFFSHLFLTNQKNCVRQPAPQSLSRSCRVHSRVVSPPSPQPGGSGQIHTQRCVLGWLLLESAAAWRATTTSGCDTQ